MRTLLCLILMTTTVYAETPLQVVTRVRAKYPNLPGNRPVSNQALKEIAADPVIKGGLLIKTTGNNCLGYSCDYVCTADFHAVDVFADWENKALPTWQVGSIIDKSRCKMLNVGPPTPEPCPNCPACPVCPTCPPINTCAFEKAEIVRLSQALSALQQKYDNVKCTTPSYFGWHSPCTVVK